MLINVVNGYLDCAQYKNKLVLIVHTDNKKEYGVFTDRFEFGRSEVNKKLPIIRDAEWSDEMNWYQAFEITREPQVKENQCLKHKYYIISWSDKMGEYFPVCETLTLEENCNGSWFIYFRNLCINLPDFNK